MKGDESKDKPESVEGVWQTAFNSMCLALDKYGPDQILDLLVIHSRNDTVACDLLTRFATVVVLGKFSYSLTIIKVNKRTLKRLEKRGCLL